VTSQVLLNERINVLAVNTRSNKEDNTALMSLTIEIPGWMRWGGCWGGFPSCRTSSRRGVIARHHEQPDVQPRTCCT
jgi:hypothetical protein